MRHPHASAHWAGSRSTPAGVAAHGRCAVGAAGRGKVGGGTSRWDSTISGARLRLGSQRRPGHSQHRRGQRPGALPQGHGLVHVAAQRRAHGLCPADGGPAAGGYHPGASVRGSFRALPWVCASLVAVEGEALPPGKGAVQTALPHPSGQVAAGSPSELAAPAIASSYPVGSGF